MAPSKKKKVVTLKPDMPALVPADCHIGKGDVEEGAQQGEGGALENCESLDPELERLLAGRCVKEDQSVEVRTFDYIKCGISTNVQTGEKRVLFWYGMLITPRKITEPNKNDLCMRFPKNYFYWFKRADVFPTLPPWHSSPCPQQRRLVHQLHSDRFLRHQVGCIIHHPHVI